MAVVGNQGFLKCSSTYLHWQFDTKQKTLWCPGVGGPRMPSVTCGVLFAAAAEAASQHFWARCTVMRRSYRGAGKTMQRQVWRTPWDAVQWLLPAPGLFFGALNSRRVAGCDRKTIAFTSLDQFVFPWVCSWRNRSQDACTPVTLKPLHCSMPSFICPYLCSKSLLGFGGNVFVFLTWMCAREKWPFIKLWTG